jgi:hypothetical protein
MASGDRRLSSEYNRQLTTACADVVPRCERGRYIERRLLAHRVIRGDQLNPPIKADIQRDGAP